MSDFEPITIEPTTTAAQGQTLERATDSFNDALRAVFTEGGAPLGGVAETAFAHFAEGLEREWTNMVEGGYRVGEALLDTSGVVETADTPIPTENGSSPAFTPPGYGQPSDTSSGETASPQPHSAPGGYPAYVPGDDGGQP